MISKLRVGIPIVGSKGWLGGASHIELHVKAVTTLPKDERPQLFLVITEESLDSYEFYRPWVSLFDSVIYMGQNIEKASVAIDLQFIHCKNWDELFTTIDFFFPVSFNVLPNRCSASWIHDFQHKHLPNFFPAHDIALRDELCQRIADQAQLIFCSSRAVESDFRRFYPDSKAITHVLALRIKPEPEWYQGDPIAVQTKYGLPDEFVLCSNQFWIHKNHRLLFAAIAQLRHAGQDIHLVCTGLPNDFRCPGYIDELTVYIEELGITDLVHILGQIPRQDQIQLIRRSLFVVQPSLFEGLSLIVQECRALGKTIVLSDLEVHMEHEYGVYFNRSDCQDLADKIQQLACHSKPGPDAMREIDAKLQAVGLTTGYARSFCKMVEQAQVLFGNNKLPAVESPVLIATSLVLSADMSSQLRAVDSWLKAGFAVVSLNRFEDIPVLKRDFPNIEFAAINRSSDDNYNAPQVYIKDLLSYLGQSSTAVCGIIEPDICLYGNNLSAAVAKEATNCLIYQEKTCVDGLQRIEGTAFPNFGCIFFDREISTFYSNEAFSLDQPWWDYWAILIPIIGRIPIKHITTPFAYHVSHSQHYDIEAMLSLGNILTKYAPPPFELSAQTLAKYQTIIAQIISNHSLDVAIYTLNVSAITGDEVMA